MLILVQMGQHWIFLTLLGFLLAGTVGFCLWWTYGRVMLLGAQYRYRYTKVPTIITPSRLSSSPTRRARRMMPTLLRRVSFKEDEEAGKVTETSYELDRRDD